MGPQLYRCGNVEHGGAIGFQYSRFNGAATLSLRKPYVGDVLVLGVMVASMGPQLYRCGNKILFNDPATSRFPLQWGRNFIVAETTLSPCRTTPGSSQLQWGRNFIVAETQGRGRAIPRIDVLQWGRNFIVAETSLPCLIPRHETALQWGRNFIVAETGWYQFALMAW